MSLLLLLTQFFLVGNQRHIQMNLELNKENGNQYEKSSFVGLAINNKKIFFQHLFLSFLMCIFCFRMI